MRSYFWILCGLLGMMLLACSQQITGGGASETTATDSLRVQLPMSQGKLYCDLYRRNPDLQQNAVLIKRDSNEGGLLALIPRDSGEYALRVYNDSSERWLSFSQSKSFIKVDSIPMVRSGEVSVPGTCLDVKEWELGLPIPRVGTWESLVKDVPQGIWSMRPVQGICEERFALDATQGLKRVDFQSISSLESLLEPWLLMPNLQGIWTGTELGWQVRAKPGFSWIQGLDAVWNSQAQGMELPAGTYLQIQHALQTQDGSRYANRYSILMDFLWDGGDLPILNTAWDNYNSADFTLDGTGRFGGDSLGGYGSQALNAPRWLRLVIRANLDQGIFEWYVNGFLQGRSLRTLKRDGHMSLYANLDPNPSFVLFGQRTPRERSLFVRRVLLFSNALEPQEIAALGGEEKPVYRDDFGD